MCLPAWSSCLIPATEATTSRDHGLSATEVLNLPVLKGPVPTTRWDTTWVESFHAQSELPRPQLPDFAVPGPRIGSSQVFREPRLAALLVPV